MPTQGVGGWRLWLLAAAVVFFPNVALSQEPADGETAGGDSQARSRPASRPATTQSAPARAGAISRPSAKGKGGGTFWRERGAERGGATLMWTMLASVVVILVLGAAALVVTKKFLPSLRARSGRDLAVLETVHLAPRVTVHLVQAGGKQFMLGTTREHVTMLAEVGLAFPDIADVADRMDQAANPAVSEGDQ